MTSQALGLGVPALLPRTRTEGQAAMTQQHEHRGPAGQRVTHEGACGRHHHIGMEPSQGWVLHPADEADEFLTVRVNSTLVSDLDVLSALLTFAADKVKAGQLDGTLHDAQGNEVGWFGIGQPARCTPVDRELFERTAPKWNCVDFADGPHYLSTGPVPPRGDCLWCGAAAADIRQAAGQL